MPARRAENTRFQSAFALMGIVGVRLGGQLSANSRIANCQLLIGQQDGDRESVPLGYELKATPRP